MVNKLSAVQSGSSASFFINETDSSEGGSNNDSKLEAF